MSGFQKAKKEQARLRLALIGPAGSGKTYTGLLLAKHLGGKIAVIDTEHGSASKYADLFEFDTVSLTDFSPEAYIGLLKEAAEAGYDIALVDSMSHEWKWCLDEVDNVIARTNNRNSYAAWKHITPRHNALTEAILQSPLHVIATMRSKMDYVLEEDEKGKKVPRKIGMAPVQRDGVEYEFDLIGDLDVDNTLVVSKTRCPELAGKVIRKPGKELADQLKVWLGTGTKPKKAAPLVAEKETKASDDGGGQTLDDKARAAMRVKLFAILDALHKAGVEPPDGHATWNDWTKAEATKMTGEESRSAMTTEQWALLASVADGLQKKAAAEKAVT